MTNQNPCPKLDERLRKLEAADTTIHLGRAVREVLLAMRSVVDAVIETKTRRTETNLEKVTIE